MADSVIVRRQSSEFATTAEFGEFIRTPAETVRYWRHVGKGPRSIKLGRRVLYRWTDIETWVAAQESDLGGDTA